MLKVTNVLVVGFLCMGLVSCSEATNMDKAHTEVATNTSKLLEEDKQWYGSARDIAEQYELNAILNLTEDYSWNFLHEGENISPEQLEPLGVYTQESLESKLGVTKDYVDSKVADFNSEQDETFEFGVPRETLQLTLNEKLIDCYIDVAYYFELATNSSSLDSPKSGSAKKDRLIQVVTLTSNDFICEQYFVWEDGSVVDYGKQGGVV